MTSFVFLRHCYVTFLLKNFWWLSIHSQGIKSTFLSLSQDRPPMHIPTWSNLSSHNYFLRLPFICSTFQPTVFSLSTSHYSHNIYLNSCLFFPEFFIEYQSICTIFPLKSQSKHNLLPQDFSADQVLSPSSESPNLLREHMSIAFLNCNYLCT